jgi:peptide/nickel transport system substrate-binding protein
MTGSSVRSKLTGKLVFVFLIALTVLLAACGGTGTNTGPSAPRASTLRVVTSPGQSNPDLFLPFFDTNHGAAWGSQGLLYEPLYFTNLYTGQASPWLATSATYNADLTQLTFKLRDGVKWNDGQPFTSADVKFTLDKMKENVALDINGLFATVIKDYSAPDASTVVIDLQKADSTALFTLGNYIYPIPQHVFQSVTGDLSKYANDTNPVGTGAYKLTAHSGDLITYDVNTNYWGKQPAVKKVQIPSIKDNSTAINEMLKGTLDWTSIGWSPDFDTQFKAKDSAHNHTWFAASNTVMLYLNLKKAPFNDLNVRKAISAAINRDGLPTGVAQYAKVANVTGVIVPTFNDWISTQYQSQKFENGQDKVDSYMKTAGYTKNSSGIWADASGKAVSFNVNVPGAWTDWAQDVQNIVSDLDKAGFDAKTNFQSGYDPYFAAISTGDYDTSICWTNSGPNPYYAYQALLSSSNSAADGKAVSGTNFERWDATTSNGYSDKVDQFLKDFAASNDPAKQKAAIQGIEDIVVSQLPVLPLTVNVYWDEYTTTNWTGWPDASNPYDSGAASNFPDSANVVLHLQPAH